MLAPTVDFPHQLLLLHLSASGGIRRHGWLRRRPVALGYQLSWALEATLEGGVALGFSAPRDALAILAEVFGTRDWLTQSASDLIRVLVRNPVDPQSAIQQIVEEEGLLHHALHGDKLYPLKDLTSQAFAVQLRTAFGRGLLLGLAEPALARESLEAKLRETRQQARNTARLEVANVDPDQFTVENTIAFVDRALALYVQRRGAPMQIPGALLAGLPEHVRAKADTQDHDRPT